MTFFAGHKQTNAKTKLSPFQVLEILELSKDVPYHFIAGFFSVSYSTVFFIANGQRWKSFTKAAPVCKRNPFKRRKKGLKLSPRKVENIRKLHKLGLSQNKLARKYKVSQPVIFDIVKRRTFK